MRGVLVTGANGFVGTALCRRLHLDGRTVRAAVRSLGQPREGDETIEVGDITGETDWTEALKNVQHVVHLAARVHITAEQSADPLTEFRRVNAAGTANLARQAAAAGVRRFVFLSSIKVNGESTSLGQPFTEGDDPAPEDPYGISKFEAEQAVRHIAAETGMEFVIIRPPLVYGPGVKANFEAMLRYIARGIPLPLAAATQNRRSLVGLDNLVDLILTCLNSPAAANQTFLASDGEDLSTADLLRRAGLALGKPARLFYVPTGLLELAAALFGKDHVYRRLCGSLQIDGSKVRQQLNWTPPVSVDEGLRRAALGLRA